MVTAVMDTDRGTERAKARVKEKEREIEAYAKLSNATNRLTLIRASSVPHASD